MDPQRCIQLLHAMPLFRQSRPEDLLVLARSARFAHVERKRLLFKPGDPCTGFHIVAQGRVALSLAVRRGVEKPLQIVEAGGSFGDITMFLERPYYLSVRALEDCLLIFVPRDAVRGLIEGDGRFAMRMLASLSLRMRSVVDDIESFSLQPPAARVITYLMRLLPPGVQTSARIELSISKNMVAAQLNLTPETLSRYFRELADRGLLTLEGRTVLVHDIDQLGEYMAAQTRER